MALAFAAVDPSPYMLNVGHHTDFKAAHRVAPNQARLKGCTFGFDLGKGDADELPQNDVEC